MPSTSTASKPPMEPPKNAYAKQIDHIKEVRRQKHLFVIERVVMLLLASLQLVLPAMVIRWLSGLFGYSARKTAVEAYAFMKPLLLLVLLLWRGLPDTWLTAIAVVFLVDVVSYWSGLIFLSGVYTKPASLSRSVLLLVVNVVEIVLGFALLYLTTRSIALSSTPTTRITGWHYSVYFSVVTFGTVGYGDIIPISPVGRLLVSLQVFVGFFFMAIVLGTFVAQLTTNRATPQK